MEALKKYSNLHLELGSVGIPSSEVKMKQGDQNQLRQFHVSVKFAVEFSSIPQVDYFECN